MKEKLKYNKFNIPDGYFDSIETEIFNKLSSETLPKKDGFSVPESYFDSIEDTILSKLSTPKDSVKVISINSNFIRRFVSISIAASFLLFFGIRFFNNSPSDINNIASSEIETWLDDNLDQINSYAITDIYEDITIENLTNSFDDDDIIHYLENTDTEFIINEL